MRPVGLPRGVLFARPSSHPASMFVVNEAQAAAIRAAFDRGGELSAAMELRRLFPGITDNAQARECARTVAAWKPSPLRPAKLPSGATSRFSLPSPARPHRCGGVLI